jgi:hypothetical protein
MAADNERQKMLAALACMASQPCVYHAPALRAGKANRAERVAEIIGHAATRWLWRLLLMEALLKNLCRLAPVNACKLLEWH